MPTDLATSLARANGIGPQANGTPGPAKPEGPFNADLVRELAPILENRPQLHKLSYRMLAAILNNISETGVNWSSAQAAGISPVHAEKIVSVNPSFKKLVAEAKEIYRQRISYAIHSRAIEGWEEPVYYKGVQVGTIRRYSDRLLLAQAKRHIPEYRDQSQVDVNVSGGVLVVGGPTKSQDQWLEEARQVKKIDSTKPQPEEPDGNSSEIPQE